MNALWERIVSRQQPIDPGVTAGLGLMALVLVLAPPTWPLVRMLATIVHEGAHAAVAVATGRRLHGITLHRDTSGLTVSSGPPRGPGMVVTLVAGYPAPALAGVATAAVLGTGYAVAYLWLLVLLLAAMLLNIRNLVGFAVLVLAGAMVGAATWFLDDRAATMIATGLCWLMLLVAPRPVFELFRLPRAARASSDPGQLARLTRVPAVVWTTLFLLLTLGALAGGAWLLLAD